MLVFLSTKNGGFQKVHGTGGLYRYSPNGKYYVRFTCNGKEVRRSLRTTDRDLAKSLAFDARREATIVDPEAGKITLATLCDKYLATVRHQARKPLAQKTYICDRIKKDWPGGSQVLIRRVPRHKSRLFFQNTVSVRALQRSFGGFRGMFSLAIGDSLLSRSPLADLKERRREKPIRLTPRYFGGHILDQGGREQCDGILSATSSR